ncbi:hypothetical protein Clacol_004414 [Clathrus columnatus]|uniref:Maltose/galactoside acetyltransferase domain-containing protein n=1 Tax=Clathrus columnatus TaxID=1419009 RepID=A0AAV5A9N7_9AGAM|nr:hypothetical protein Clacol_004414 [Clathrus columnatus]
MFNEEAAEHALTEREKMTRGLPYLAMEDPDLVAGRLRARKYLKAYNDYPPATFQPGMPGNHYFGPDERFQILADLFGMSLEVVKRDIAIEPPFWCDYGANIEFKDCAKVTIGSRVMFAPGVQLYAATHSVDVVERREGLERAYPIIIGDDVKGDIPDNVVIGGVPARILKRLDPPPPMDS